jgi:hypothetical protein
VRLIISPYRNDIRKQSSDFMKVYRGAKGEGLRRGQYKKTLQVQCPIDLEELAHKKNRKSKSAALDKYKYKNEMNTASLPVTSLTTAALLYFRLGHSLSVASFSSVEPKKLFSRRAYQQVYIEPPQIPILILSSRIGRDIPATGDESCGHGLIEREFSYLYNHLTAPYLCPLPCPPGNLLDFR